MEVFKSVWNRYVGKAKDGLVALRDDVQGATMVEYSVLIGLLTAAVVAIIITVGTWITTQWQTLCTNITGAAC